MSKSATPFKHNNGFFRYMDCSTCHIRKDVSKSITDIESLIVYPHDYGWWVFVPEEIYDDVPKCLRDILFYARGGNAQWVKLDVDGWTWDALPKYNW
jgi:hypothetical protein